MVVISWDEYWRAYSASKAEKWLIAERDKILKRYLDRVTTVPKRVLEVGCGFGSNIRMLHHTRKDVCCWALDSSIEAIRAVKEDVPYGVVADCRYTGFPDDSFDLVYSAGLMEHFSDEVPFLEEMKRIMKGSGYLVTIVPARYSLWKLYQLLHFGFWKHGYEKAYSYDGLRRLFRDHGFIIVDIVGIDPFSISGFIMKFLNISFDPPVKRSPQRSAYTELCVIARKRSS